jgi:hypothetical protein
MVDLVVDDVTALATPDQFKRLMEYSGTIPTGMYAGKRWKRGEPYVAPTRWLLGEYYDLPDEPDQIGIRWRELLVVA